MTSQELPDTSLLEILRLDRIRTRLLAFAVVIAMLPALATGWVSYTGSKAELRDRTGANLQVAAQQAARETDIWFKDRLHDLRIFASSYEVTENLARARGGSLAARAQLRGYLASVRGRFDDYLQLQANGPDGTPVAVTPAESAAVVLEPVQVAQLRAGEVAFGAISREAQSRASLVMAVPVTTAEGRFLGSLAVRLQLSDLGRTLDDFAPRDGGRLMLTRLDGTVAPVRHSSRSGPDSLALATLLEAGGRAVEYRDRHGYAMLGSAAQMIRAPWFAVAELAQSEAYAELNRFRNIAVLVVLLIALALGGVGYLIGLHVVRPIDGLARAASGVAAGNLDIELPVVGRDEVASLTEVFNDMVRQLREDRRQIAAMEEQLKRRNRELEELSITDGLTGLRNRRHIMATLEQEVGRARRSRRPLSVMMLDVDHFKQLNDRFGHQTGDEVLVKVAGIIRSAVRGVDGAGRYGGEEFIVLLPETDRAAARDVAERIRTTVARGVSVNGGGHPVTLSIGVATFPVDGEEAAPVIARADAALYRAKEGGRNRVELAGDEPRAPN